jgi:hypothetical protein
MKRTILYLMMIALVLLSWVAVASSASAAPQATYELVKSSIGPGGSGNAGIYTMSSSVGQPAAGEVSAGIYTLGGGFWGGGVIVPARSNYTVFLPLVLR